MAKTIHLPNYIATQPGLDLPYEVTTEDHALCGSRGRAIEGDIDLVTCDACRSLETSKLAEVEAEVAARNESARLADAALSDLDGEEPDVTGAEPGDEKSVRQDYAEALAAAEETGSELAAVVATCEWWRAIFEDERLGEVWARYRVTAQELERQVLATDKAADLVELRANVRARRALHDALADPFEGRRTAAQRAFDEARERVERIEQAYPLLVGGQDLAAEGA